MTTILATTDHEVRDMRALAETVMDAGSYGTITEGGIEFLVTDDNDKFVVTTNDDTTVVSEQPYRNTGATRDEVSVLVAEDITEYVVWAAE